MNLRRVIVLSAFSLGVGPASAAPAYSGGAVYDYARVDRVTLQTRVVDVPVASEQCWEEPVTYYEPPTPPGYHSYTSTIAGGIVGAVVGHQFGSGSGRDYATIAGSALGASVGRDYAAARAFGPGRAWIVNEQRCRIVSEVHQEERADGYLVSYSYNGRQYETRTAEHPGDRLRVRVDVVPIP